jgi:hypothetical protein
MIDYQPLPEAQQKRIAAVIADKKRGTSGGVSHASRIFKCARQTIKAAAAGQPVHPYIAGKLAEAIAARDKEGKVP